MGKFESEEDDGFFAICGELRRWIKDMTAISAAGEPVPAEQTQDLPIQRRDSSTMCT
jgi:hypothetical protein